MKGKWLMVLAAVALLAACHKSSNGGARLSRPATLVGVIEPIQGGASRYAIEIVTATGAIPIELNQGSALIGHRVRLVVRYLNGGPEFRILQVDDLSGGITPRPQAPPPNPYQQVHYISVQVSSELAHAKRVIQDQGANASELKSQLSQDRFYRPDLLQTKFAMYREDRRAEVATIEELTHVLPSEVTQWRSDLNGIHLAGNAAAASLAATTRAELDWLSGSAMPELSSVMGRLQALKIP